jgi:glycosyltransferase involved in cell wall biosynthesis
MIHSLPIVTFIIVARNAARYLRNIFSDFLNQTYPKENLELILIDGCSEDNTLEIMESFKHRHTELNIKILDNPGKILSSGWNEALAAATGEVIIRVDAQSKIPSEFISKNVEHILKGENIVGGATLTLMPEGIYKYLIALADTSRFGGGAALFRNLCYSGYVDTIAYAAYRRDVFQKVGGYDERLGRTEDNEIHYRMKKAGFQFYYNPEIKSFHVARSSLTGLMKQKYGNGLWIGLTLGIQPKCFGLRHFVPFFFIIAFSGTLLLGVLYNWVLFLSLMSLYLLVALLYAFKIMWSDEAKNVRAYCLFLPCIFLLMHLSYGLGTVIGLVKMPIFVLKNRNYVIPRPIK